MVIDIIRPGTLKQIADHPWVKPFTQQIANVCREDQLKKVLGISIGQSKIGREAGLEAEAVSARILESEAGQALKKQVNQVIQQTVEQVQDLPEEQMKRVKKEIKKQICEELLKDY